MISHIRGEIDYCGEGFVVIDVGGVGYHVNVPTHVLQKLKSENKKNVKLYTYLSVKEDNLSLYGFTDIGELEMFKMLISVSGIGPQIAMNILSQIKIEDLADAVLHENEKLLMSISGIGKKNAKRLILELKERIRKKIRDIPEKNISYDAVSALVSLGFRQDEAWEAVNAVAKEIKDADVETLIKEALLRLRK